MLDGTLNTLSDQTDQVAVRTSTIGRETLKRDLRRITDDHQAVSANAKELVEQLQTSLQKWAEFESSHNSFTAWLESAMHIVRSASEMTADLDSKLEQVRRLKVDFTLTS